MSPEEKARQTTDAQLMRCGWTVQTKDPVNLSASRGVAVCELSFATGEPDDTLFVDGKAIGTTEAKPEGDTLTGVEEQSTKYVSGVPFGLQAWKSPLPFCYESTGTETFFTNRPYKQRLTEPMLKELEKKLRDNHAAWTEANLWNVFAATRPGKVKGRSQAGRFADLVALVRFALEQQPVLAPFADSVSERFNEWLRTKDASVSQPPTINSQPTEPGILAFTPDQLSWLGLIKDHIATAISIEPEDFERAPFNQRGGLGKAHQLFGEQLPKLLDELNQVLAA
jgi:hypothetical protein